MEFSHYKLAKNIFFGFNIITHILKSRCKVINCTQQLGKVNSIMANIKSAKKRVLIAEANRQRNVAFKSSIKTAVKKALELATSEDKEALNAAISKAYQLCDKAVVKGILHKNTAARKKSRLVLAIKRAQANA